jgi:hypothetical protein
MGRPFLLWDAIVNRDDDDGFHRKDMTFDVSKYQNDWFTCNDATVLPRTTMLAI